MNRIIQHALGFATAMTAIAAAAQPASQQYQLQIERTTLRMALQELSKQTGVSVALLAPDDEQSKAMVGPVKGLYTIDSALDAIVVVDGLTHVRTATNGVAVISTGSAKPALIRSSQVTPAPVEKRKAAGTGGARTDVRDRAASAEDGVETVIVTAQRRAERLENVPIAITVLGGDNLDQSSAQGVTEALNSVPGVITTAPIQGGTAQVAVRGVTAGAGFQNGSSPIAYYLDSVPFALVKTALVPDSSAYDLERVEVLRGPQGTLYGASAQNGVVRILTRDPNLNDYEFKMRTSLSDTEYAGENYRGDFAFNAPIVEGKLAARAVVGYQNMSGWIDKPGRPDANDAEVTTARLKLLARPTEDLSIGLSGWISRSDFGAQNAGDEQRRRSSALDESIQTDYDVFGLKVGYELPGATITAATGYLEYQLDSNLDYLGPLIGIPGNLLTAMDSKVFSQEITVNSSGDGDWRWSFGAMYRNGKDRLLQTLFVLAAPIDFSDESESFAVFGEVTRLFAEGRYELTLGLRHFEDDVTQSENQRHTGIASEPLYRANGTFDADSPRVVLTWHPVDNSTIYASYSEGFRSGFNQNANVPVGLFPAVKADTLKNSEIGTKGRFADGRVSIDAAVFYIDWQDVQQTLTVDNGGVAVAAPVNGESASGIGAELGILAQPVDGLALGLNVSWNDLTADSAVNSLANSISLFAKGDRLNFSPEYTAGASLDYTFDLGAGGYEGHFASSGSYSSEQSYRNVLGNVVVTDLGEPMLIVNTSFAVVSPHGWTATLFIDNVNNEQDPGVGLFNVPDWNQRTRPRTAGVQFEYQF